MSANLPRLPPGGRPPEAPGGPDPLPPPTFDIPNAERYVLEADVMRRRQLRSALLHGSRRTWREHRRVWPAVVVGIVVAAVIIAAMAVGDAVRKTQQIEQQDSPSVPTPTASVPPTSGPGGPATGGAVGATPGVGTSGP